MQTGESTTRGRRGLPSPAWLVAVAALIAALAGSAVAIDKITSKDIAKNAVRSKHIKEGQVKADEANFVKHVRAAGVLAVPNDPAPVNLTPKITFKAKRGDLLAIHGRVDASKASSGSTCGVWVDLDGPVNPGRLLVGETAAGPDRLYVSAAGLQTTNPLEARPITVPIVEPGRYAVSLLGGTTLSSDCGYSNRNLWLGLIR